MIVQLDYRTVATHYGCASKNNGSRVMEEIADRVPDGNDMESRTVSADDAMGVGGRHIEISFADPEIADFEYECDSVNRPMELVRRQHNSDHWL